MIAENCYIQLCAEALLCLACQCTCTRRLPKWRVSNLDDSSITGNERPCQSLLAHKSPLMGPERTVEMVITVL